MKRCGQIRLLRDSPRSVRGLGISFLTRKHVRPVIQLLQPFSHFLPARQTSHAVFTVGSVDSKKGHYVADSSLHFKTHAYASEMMNSGCCVSQEQFRRLSTNSLMTVEFFNSDSDRTPAPNVGSLAAVSQLCGNTAVSPLEAQRPPNR